MDSFLYNFRGCKWLTGGLGLKSLKFYFWSLFVLLFFCLILLFKLDHQPRVAYPHDIAASTSSDLVAIPAAELRDATVNVALAPDYSDFSGSIASLGDLNFIDDFLSSEKSNNVHRNHYVMAFHLTSNLVPGCSATIQIHDEVIQGSCKKFGDINFMIAPFKKGLVPGVHKVRFISTEGEFEIYAYKGINNSIWVGPYSLSPFDNVAAALWVFFKSRPLSATGYVAIVVLMLCLSIFSMKINSNVIIVSCSLLCFVAAATVSNYLTGHDETAHLDTLHTSAALASGIPRDEIEALKVDFYDKFRFFMLENDFYRYHGVPVPTNGMCPHMVVGGCVDTFTYAGADYYSILWKLIGSPDPRPFSLEQFSWIARLANLFLLCLSIFLIWYCCGLLVTVTVSAMLPFMGAVLGQVGSTTNDIFLYALGLCFTGGFIALFYSSLKKPLLFFGIIALWSLAAIFVDNVGYLAFVPLTLLILVFALMKSGLVEHFRGQVGFLYLILVYLISFFVVLLGVRSLIIFAQEESLWFRSLMLSAPSDFERLKNIGVISFYYSLKGFGILMKSMLGSFIWGHAYYSAMGYAVIVCMVGFFGLFGMRKMARTKFNVNQLVIFFVLAVFLALHVIINEGISSQTFFVESRVLRDAYLKPRFTAPLLGSIWAVIGLFFYKVVESKRVRSTYAMALSFFVLIFMFYWNMRIFIGDML